MTQTVLESVPLAKSQAIRESGLSALQLQHLTAAGIVSINPNIVSGAVVFAGTRVPIYNLWDYLNGGDSIEDFLESFPTVRREQVQQALELVQGNTTNGRLPAREHSL